MSEQTYNFGRYNKSNWNNLQYDFGAVAVTGVSLVTADGRKINLGASAVSLTSSASAA